MCRFNVCFLALAAALVVGASAAQAQRLTVVAGGATADKVADKDPIAATDAQLNGPFGVEFNRAGVMFIVEMPGQRVLAVDPQGGLRAIAGNGKKGFAGDDGPAAAAQFNGMHNLIVAPDDDIYIADTWNNSIRRIDAKTQMIHPFAGTGKKGFGGDGGPAAKAEFGGVYCIALTPNGEKLYVADLDNRRIRAIAIKTGVVETVAGNGEKGAPQEGAVAVESPLLDPRAVAADKTGAVYILERNGNALRVVDPQGKIRTLIGPGAAPCKDETGQRAKPLKGPKHLCVDRQGNVLIADTENHLIRKYLPRENKLIRVAGTGKRGAALPGSDPLTAELNQPHGVYLHPAGDLYISDSSNNRVLKIEP